MFETEFTALVDQNTDEASRQLLQIEINTNPYHFLKLDPAPFVPKKTISDAIKVKLKIYHPDKRQSDSQHWSKPTIKPHSY